MISVTLTDVFASIWHEVKRLCHSTGIVNLVDPPADSTILSKNYGVEPIDLLVYEKAILRTT